MTVISQMAHIKGWVGGGGLVGGWVGVGGWEGVGVGWKSKAG